MADKAKRVDYFYLQIDDRPGEAFGVLSKLKEAGVLLLNCTGFPTSGGKSQMTLVPADTEVFLKACQRSGLSVSTKKQAFLAQGTDRVGAVAEIFQKLAQAKINITAYNATSGQGGGYGLVFFVRPQDLEATARALGI